MTMQTSPRAITRGIVAVRADAGGDVKTILASLQKDWADFKSEQDEAVKALKKGQEDVVKAEKIDRINASVSELQAAVDQANAKLAAMSISGAPGTVKDAEYTDAFRAHFRKGDVQAALNKGTASEGGYLAPVEWDRTIVDKLVQISPMRQIAQVQNISTNGFAKMFNSLGMGSGWVGETAARPQTTTPTIGTMTYGTGEIYANPAATQQLLDDAEVNLEQWIANEVQTEFAYQEGLAFISGTGVNKPAGFLTYVTGAANAAVHPWGAIPTGVTTGSATSITADNLLDLAYSMPSELAANARFVMNRNTVASVRKLKDGNGNYLWQPSFQAGEPASILNYPLTEMAGMPSPAANAFPVAFGDFRRGYLIIDRVGVRVLRDPFTNKPYVHFYTTKRVGGGLLNPEVLRVLRMAAA